MTAALIDGEKQQAWVADALRSLSARETLIIRARLMDDDSETLESLGRKLGVSKERVRQIETRAMDKLRRVLVELRPGSEALGSRQSEAEGKIRNRASSHEVDTGSWKR